MKRKHILIDGGYCWCVPSLEICDDGWVLIHNDDIGCHLGLRAKFYDYYLDGYAIIDESPLRRVVRTV